jgi:hypothetical protein
MSKSSNTTRVPSVVKLKKGEVVLISRVDRTKYLLSELIRAALKDVGRLIKYEISRKISSSRARSSLFRAKNKRRLKYAFSTWVGRKNELIISARHDTWYSALQELGTSGPGGNEGTDRKQPKRATMRDVVYNNIDKIRIIEGQYLSAIEDENRALGLIDDSDEENFEEEKTI